MTTSSWHQHYPAGVPATAPRLAQDITAVWRARVAANPGGLALVHEDVRMSAAELEQAAESFAVVLQNAGIGRGDRVALMLQNVPSAPVVLLAAWRLGAMVPLINPMYHGEELRHLLADSGARALVVDPELLSTVRAVLDGTSVQLLWVDAVEGAADGSVSIWQAMQDIAGEVSDHVAPAPDDVALLTYTSGTTGPPKGAMNSHGNILSVAATSTSWLSLDATDRVLCVAPIFHITGVVFTLVTPLLAGAAVVLLGRTTPEAVAAALPRDQVTTMTGSITVYNGLAKLPEVTKDTFATVRHLWSGGAPVPPATVTRFREQFGQYIHNVYGMTETSSACIGVPPGVEAPVDDATGALSIGVPFPGVQVRVVDPAGSTVAPGQAGELEISGPPVVAGYWNNPEATDLTFVAGALRTGDGAVIDDDGWVYIVDRLKDQINTSGYKVWPREVEDVLHAHPGVHEAAVVGVPDDYRGEAVVAYVVPKSSAPGSIDEREVRDFARRRLAAYKVPRRVVLLEELPKTPTGKMRRQDLRQSGVGEV